MCIVKFEQKKKLLMVITFIQITAIKRMKCEVQYTFFNQEYTIDKQMCMTHFIDGTGHAQISGIYKPKYLKDTKMTIQLPISIDKK